MPELSEDWLESAWPCTVDAVAAHSASRWKCRRTRLAWGKRSAEIWAVDQGFRRSATHLATANTYPAARPQ